VLRYDQRVDSIIVRVYALYADDPRVAHWTRGEPPSRTRVSATDSQEFLYYAWVEFSFIEGERVTVSPRFWG